MQYFCAEEGGRGFGAGGHFPGQVKDRCALVFGMNPGDAAAFPAMERILDMYCNQILWCPAEALTKAVDQFMMISSSSAAGSCSSVFLYTSAVFSASRYTDRIKAIPTSSIGASAFPIGLTTSRPALTARIVHPALVCNRYSSWQCCSVPRRRISAPRNLKSPHSHFEAGAELLQILWSPSDAFSATSERLLSF